MKGHQNQNPKNLERGDFVVYKSTETSNLLHLAVVREFFPKALF